MQDVCLPISGNQVQRAGNADGFFIEIDGKQSMEDVYKDIVASLEKSK